MVKLEEVEDEAFVQEKNANDEDDWDTDSDDSSVLSSTSDDPQSNLEHETIFDRITALKDAVPPRQRARINRAASSTRDWSWWGVSGLAKGAWLFGVSVMLLGIPFTVALNEEQQFAEEERRQTLQRDSNDVGLFDILFRLF
ncbi:MAG: mitochondrial import receptor protein [Alyxoria varia]|nr:MAG: mitochondrial import receptor protein [Alyxoria varia]